MPLAFTPPVQMWLLRACYLQWHPDKRVTIVLSYRGCFTKGHPWIKYLNPGWRCLVWYQRRGAFKSGVHKGQVLHEGLRWSHLSTSYFQPNHSSESNDWIPHSALIFPKPRPQHIPMYVHYYSAQGIGIEINILPLINTVLMIWTSTATLVITSSYLPLTYSQYCTSIARISCYYASLWITNIYPCTTEQTIMNVVILTEQTTNINTRQCLSLHLRITAIIITFISLWTHICYSWCGVYFQKQKCWSGHLTRASKCARGDKRTEWRLLLHPRSRLVDLFLAW